MTYAKSDGKISLFEFLLLTFLDRHLRRKSSAPVSTKYRSINTIQPELAILIWVLVKASTGDVEEQSRLFAHAGLTLWGKLEKSETAHFSGIKNVSIQDLNKAFNKVQHLSPRLKQPVLETCIDLVMADQQVTYREYEILRVLADSLDCPLPPLILQ